MAFNLYHAAEPAEKDRWLNAGIEYLTRGARMNPETFELFFDIGWTHFMKTKDYGECIRYFREAARREHPQWVDHMLAHSYERAGRIRDAYRVWLKLKRNGSSHPSFERVVDRFLEKLSKRLREGDSAEEEPESEAPPANPEAQPRAT